MGAQRQARRHDHRAVGRPGTAAEKKRDALIDECSDDSNALTNDQRQQKEAELLADILDCERSECALCDLALAQGINISHRDDVSAQAILGVQLIAASASASPDTSPGWINK